MVVVKRGRGVERSHLKRRLWRAVPLLIAGTLAIAFALVPQTWRDAIAAALSLALAWLVSLGALVVALALGIGLLLSAVLALVVSRLAPPQELALAPADGLAVGSAPARDVPSSPGAKLVQVNGIAPVSVYLDLENQVGSHEVAQFTSAVREFVGSRAADLYFYSNAATTATGKVYKALWKRGFRPIDVPFKHLGVRSAKNIVDVDLSLHAYHRAAFGPPQQVILLITEDQDYIPLVFRLRALGHLVTIWASSLPESYKQLQGYLGISYREFGTEFGKSVPADAQKPVVKPARKPVSSKLAHPTARTAPVSHTVLSASSETLREAIMWVPRVMEGISDEAPDAFNRLSSKLGTLDGDILARLGHLPAANNKRVVRWLEQLDALGVIVLSNHQKLPKLGTVSPADAAQTLESFLGAVAAVLTSSAYSPQSDRILLAEVCALVAGAPATQLTEFSELRRLIAPEEPPRPASIGHMRHFLETARALGIIQFENIEDPDSIHVIMATAPDGAGRAGTSPPA